MLSRLVRIDGAVVAIDGEEDGALEPLLVGQNLGELWQRLLGAVFLVAADQNDVLSLAGAGIAFEYDTRAGSVRPAAETQQE